MPEIEEFEQDNKLRKALGLPLLAEESEPPVDELETRLRKQMGLPPQPKEGK